MNKKFGVGIDMVEIKRFEDKIYQMNKPTNPYLDGKVVLVK